jgi:hypothetical protein
MSPCALNIWPFSTLLRGPNTWKSHGDRFRLNGEWSSTFQRMEHSVFRTVYATCRTLSCNTMTSLMGITGQILLMVAHILVGLQPSAQGTEWHLVLFVLMYLFCCTAHCQLLVHHTHSRVSSTVSCIHCRHHEQVSFEQLSYIMYNNHFNISLQRQKIPHCF